MVFVSILGTHGLSIQVDVRKENSVNLGQQQMQSDLKKYCDYHLYFNDFFSTK